MSEHGPAARLLAATYFPKADPDDVEFSPTNVAWYLSSRGAMYGRVEFSNNPDRFSLVGYELFVPGLTVGMQEEEAAALCLLASDNKKWLEQLAERRLKE